MAGSRQSETGQHAKHSIGIKLGKEITESYISQGRHWSRSCHEDRRFMGQCVLKAAPLVDYMFSYRGDDSSLDSNLSTLWNLFSLVRRSHTCILIVSRMVDKELLQLLDSDAWLVES
jgi:hypothetical protein